MIRKSSGGYTVYARSGRKMGTYRTKAEADARKAQLEMFKAMRAPAFSPGHRGGRTQRSPRAQYVYIDTSDGKIYELIQKDRPSGGVTLQRIGLTATPPIYVPNARFQRVFVPRKASHTDIMLFRGPQHSWPGQPRRHARAAKLGVRRAQRSPGTRSYEYVVYPEARVAGDGVKVEGFGEKAFQAAARYAKSLPQWGAGIYSVSKGRFVSYVGRSGRMVPIGYPR